MVVVVVVVGCFREKFINTCMSDFPMKVIKVVYVLDNMQYLIFYILT